MRSLIRYVGFTTITIACFFLASCENDMGEVDALMKKKIAIEEAANVTSYVSSDGKIKAKLKSPFMLIHQTDSAYVEFPRTLHVDFYNDSAKNDSYMDAMYAMYKEFEKKVFLKDSVVVINFVKGDTLRTDELWWDQDRQEFFTDKPVRIYQPDKTIYGVGLKAAQDLSWYDIFKISGVVLYESDKLE